LQLQVEKESDLAAINDFNITNNERYKKGIEESITAIQTKVDAEQKEYDAIKKKTLLTDKEKDFVETYDKQAAALKELKAQQSEVNQAIAIGYINRDKFTKAGNQKLALKDLEEAENAYRKLAEERKQAVDVEAASGQYQDIIAKKNLQNIKDEISDLQQLWILTKNSTISDEDKKAKLDGITRALTGLNRQAQILQAGIKATNKQHFFTASQLKDVQKAISFIQAAENTIAKFGQLATQITQQNADKRIAIYQAENDAYTEGLKGRLEAGFISQQEYDRKKAEADKVLQKKKQEEQHKAFVAQKAVAIVQATISTALAVVNALATAPTFIAGIVFAALAAAAGAAEIAVIATQKEPTALASGGIFQGSGTVTGNGGSRDDSVNARLSNGESVMNAKSTRAFAPLLSAMNQMGGGVAFAGTPTIQNAPTGVSSNGTASPSPASPTKVYVTESDITRTQNKVSVIQKRSTW
ncbi:MAG: hypothetical protein JST76_00170, partial [Bacteroidetes bacterium]|nr:hypothetical protein [Bacteroidota bacterium]